MAGKKEEIQAKFMDLKVYRFLKFKREREMERSVISAAIESAEKLDIYASLIRLNDRGIITKRNDKESKKTYYKFARRDDELESLNYALEGPEKAEQAEPGS
jgi:hypothetical protein